MSRHYKIGNNVVVIRDTKASNAYGQSTGYTIDKGSKAVVVSYNTKYTNKIDDDLAKIKIISGDQNLNGKEVWVRSEDFERIIRKY